jgi:hypothetical protein
MVCYDGVNSPLACGSAQMGQDAKENQGVSVSYTGPTAHSTFTADFTTTDNSTGLVWRSCSTGKSTGTCTGTSTTQSFALHTTACTALNSLNAGNGYAGLTNWRLPTMKELTTLTDFNLTGVEINAIAFPTTINFAYWSSTPYPPNLVNAWYVDYQIEPNSYAAANGSAYHGRCVSAPVFPETRSFTDNGNLTITDNTTGLIWGKCPIGDPMCTGVGGNAASWQAALTDCSASTLTGKTWRLPNRNELDTIYDFTKATGSAIDLTYFPNTFGGNFWTSTTGMNGVASAWHVHFSTGFNELSAVTAKNNTITSVRCVTGP